MESSHEYDRRRFLRLAGAALATAAGSGCFWSGPFRRDRKYFKKKRKEREKHGFPGEDQDAEALAEHAEQDQKASRSTQPERVEPLNRQAPSIELSKQVRGIFGFSTDFPIFRAKNVEQVAKQVHLWGVNAVWVTGKIVRNRELLEALHAWDIKVYLSIGMFVGWRARNRPITSDGTPLQPYVPGHWYQGTCPNQPGYVEKRVAEIKAIARACDIDGIWLDAIRYPGFWETPKPRLKMTCFDPVCLSEFERWTGLTIPKQNLSVKDKAAWILENHADEWFKFRIENITGVVKRCAEALKDEKPRAILGLFTVPWRRKETRGGEKNAIERIMAQDYPALARYADAFSPMVYHRMCGEPVRWIAGITDWVAGITKKPVYPVVQAHSEPRCSWNPYRLSNAEFGQALIAARGGASSGVIVFSLESLLREKKLPVMVQNYSMKTWGNA